MSTEFKGISETRVQTRLSLVAVLSTLAGCSSQANNAVIIFSVAPLAEGMIEMLECVFLLVGSPSSASCKDTSEGLNKQQKADVYLHVHVTSQS